MLRILSVFIILFCGATSCSTNPWRKRYDCISNDEIASYQNQFESLADTHAELNKVPPGSTHLVKNECYKKVFSRRGYSWILFANPNDKFIGITGSFGVEKSPGTDFEECLHHAIRRISDFKNPYADKILEDYHNTYENLWNDPDLGPVKWLACTKGNPADMSEYATLLHELNHELKKGPCLNFPFKPKKICFDLSPELPEADLAKIDTSIFKIDERRKAINDFQNLYTTKKQNFFTLVDEVVSYSISADIDRIKFGELKVPHNGKCVAGSPLPLILDLALNYLNQLQVTNPRQYLRSFGEDTSNRASLIAIVQEAERVHKDWLSDLSKTKCSINSSDTILWQLYDEFKKKTGI